MPVQFSQSETDWNAIYQHLQAGKYEIAAQSLLALQLGARQTGDEASAAAATAAREVCMVLISYETEIEWHQLAQGNAEERKQVLAKNVQELVQETIMSYQRSTPDHAARAAPQDQEVGTERQNPEAQLQHVSDNIDAREIERQEAVVREKTSEDLAIAEFIGSQPPNLAIFCFGSFRLYQHGRRIDEWNGIKGLSIFKYLVIHRGTPVSKEVLMDVFWSDADPEAARHNLHQAVYSLRQTLRRQDPEAEHIRFENNQYSLNSNLSIWVDVEEFEERVRRGRSLEFSGRLDEALREYEIAETVYQGALLEEDLYEDWSRARREHLRNAFLEIGDRMTKYYVDRGAYAPAINLCQKLLGEDPAYENAHRRLMRCYLAQGQRSLAIRQYQTCVKALREELAVPPSSKTTALVDELNSDSGKSDTAAVDNQLDDPH